MHRRTAKEKYKIYDMPLLTYGLSILGFMKTAFPFMIISIAIAQVWLMVFKPA